jgi:hypothetical protein
MKPLSLTLSITSVVFAFLAAILWRIVGEG